MHTTREHRLIFLMASTSPAGGENIVMASLRQVKNDVDDHIGDRFDIMSDGHAVLVGVLDITKKLTFDTLSAPYHFAVGNRFNVKRASNHPFASIGQGLNNTGQSIKDRKIISTGVNAFTTVTDSPVEDISRLVVGSFNHTLEQVEGKGI